MKKQLNFKFLGSIILVISLLISFTSCDKEPVNEPPELPPLESLVMDFSDFSEQPGGMKSTDASYENFLHAYLSVTLWNFASTITLAVPVAAYAVALNQDPEYLGDHTWEWAFDFSLNSLNYTATLTGTRISNEEFSMEMVISEAGSTDQGVKWFDGIVRYDHTHATWNLYKEEGTIKMLEAEWNKDFETEEADLTYTYVETGQVETGSYIMMEYLPDVFYDASYTISLAAGMTVIKWNTETIEGRAKAPNKFEDSDWHCWDSAANGLVDKVCE